MSARKGLRDGMQAAIMEALSMICAKTPGTSASHVESAPGRKAFLRYTSIAIVNAGTLPHDFCQYLVIMGLLQRPSTYASLEAKSPVTIQRLLVET